MRLCEWRMADIFRFTNVVMTSPTWSSAPHKDGHCERMLRGPPLIHFSFNHLRIYQSKWKSSGLTAGLELNSLGCHPTTDAVWSASYSDLFNIEYRLNFKSELNQIWLGDSGSKFCVVWLKQSLSYTITKFFMLSQVCLTGRLRSFCLLNCQSTRLFCQ